MRLAKTSPNDSRPREDLARAGAASMAALFCLSGCDAIGAPSLSLFGAFFPGWLVCGILGVAGGGVSRAIMVASGLAQRLPLQLAVNASVGLIVALFAWLAWFGL